MTTTAPHPLFEIERTVEFGYGRSMVIRRHFIPEDAPAGVVGRLVCSACKHPWDGLVHEACWIS
ncbi:hypothetical protein ABZ319_23620 [Nocardia sp. NPDC005978]|uniref:hypothetical protein n=1 Tax=Nocardia sp. NPDC005978 TaxID=3156725 RepID=UPI0033BD8818